MRKKVTCLTAVALVAGSASPASAVVVSFLNQDIFITNTFEGVAVDLETGNVATNQIDGLVDGDMNFLFGGEWITNDADATVSSPTWQPVRVGTAGSATNSSVIRKLGLGAVVDSGSNFATGYGGSTGHIEDPPSNTAPNETFGNGERGFIGFSLELSGGGTAYGWVDVTLYDDGTEGIIHGWAYEDDGTSLAVGAIPEPSQTVMLGLGALGLALRRRRSAS